MKVRSLFILLTLSTDLLLLSPPPSHAAASLELYGTFHAVGVIVTIGTDDDPDRDGVASVAYRLSGSAEPYRQGYPLSRVSDTRFVGSLFWLEPGTVYDVRVTFSDPDGDPLDGVVVADTASTRAEITISAPNHSYYVSPAGSGTACSLAAPCSLTEGLDGAGPGDEVVLRGGIYYQGEISLPRSGTSGAPIVIRGYEGETAVLDGADPVSFTWAAQGGGVYQTTVNVADSHLVLASGERLYPYQSLSDLQDLRWGIPGFYGDGTVLYVHLEGGTDPNGVTMVVSRYSYAFHVVQDFIYFLDLTFRYYGQGHAAKAINFSNASDNLVRGCTFAINDTGVVIRQESHRNVIQGNEFYDTIFDWPWDAVKAGSSLETGGVRIGYSTTSRGTVIRGNVFHDYFDGSIVCPWEAADVTNETDIYENLVYNAGDDGMATDGQCSNVRIWGNTFHDVLMGISLAPVYIGPVYAIRNLIYRIGAGNNDYTGSSFKFSSNYGPSGPMYFFHNTADAVLPGGDGIRINEPGTWELIYARNNVWAGTVYALRNRNTGQPVDLDYDDLWNGNSGDLVRWGSTSYATLADFIAATGQEPHGLSIEPGFADAGSGDYTLDPSSGLIDAGIIIPGINDDYVGAAPDIGAFEYEDYGFTLTVAPPSRTIGPGGVATYTIGVQPTGGFTATVSLVAGSPSPSLTLSLVPAVIAPLSQAILTITDSHAETPLPGLWYTVPITGTSGDVTRTTSVGLFVRGACLYLPIILRHYLFGVCWIRPGTMVGVVSVLRRDRQVVQPHRKFMSPRIIW